MITSPAEIEISNRLIVRLALSIDITSLGSCTVLKAAAGCLHFTLFGTFNVGNILILAKTYPPIERNRSVIIGERGRTGSFRTCWMNRWMDVHFGMWPEVEVEVEMEKE